MHGDGGYLRVGGNTHHGKTEAMRKKTSQNNSPCCKIGYLRSIPNNMWHPEQENEKQHYKKTQKKNAVPVQNQPSLWKTVAKKQTEAPGLLPKPKLNADLWL